MYTSTGVTIEVVEKSIRSDLAGIPLIALAASSALHAGRQSSCLAVCCPSSFIPVSRALPAPAAVTVAAVAKNAAVATTRGLCNTTAGHLAIDQSCSATQRSCLALQRIADDRRACRHHHMLLTPSGTVTIMPSISLLSTIWLPSLEVSDSPYARSSMSSSAGTGGAICA